MAESMGPGRGSARRSGEADLVVIHGDDAMVGEGISPRPTSSWPTWRTSAWTRPSSSSITVPTSTGRSCGGWPSTSIRSLPMWPSVTRYRHPVGAGRRRDSAFFARAHRIGLRPSKSHPVDESGQRDSRSRPALSRNATSPTDRDSALRRTRYPSWRVGELQPGFRRHPNPTTLSAGVRQCAPRSV